MSLKRSATLRTPKQFKFVFDNATKIYGEHFTVLFRLNGEEHSRLGLIIPKKHTGNAIIRNTIRRIIKESFRSSKVSVDCVDIVVLSKRHVRTVSNVELRKSIDIQFDKLHKRLYG